MKRTFKQHSSSNAGSFVFDHVQTVIKNCRLIINVIPQPVKIEEAGTSSFIFPEQRVSDISLV